MKIKSLLITAVLATAILCSGGFVKAETADNSALIAQLQAQIQSLMQQIAALQTQGGTTTAWCHTFNRNLKFGDFAQAGDTGDEIYDLQTALEKEGFSYAKNDNANSGSGSMIFGENTASAVVAFQEKYASEILTPVGLRHGNGYVGAKTRAKLNALYGCGVTPPTTCTPNWSCSSWTACNNSNQSRTCNDLNNCGVTTYKPATTQGCTATCTPVWQCGAWSTCTNNQQTRVCTDNMNCGITTNEPSLTQTCGATQPLITVTSPNGGETWQLGNNYQVSWTNTGVTGNLYLTIVDSNGGSVCYLGTVPATINSLPVNISTDSSILNVSGKTYCPSIIPGANYKLKILDGGTITSKTLAVSTNYFSIVAPTVTELCPDINGDGLVTVSDVGLVQRALNSKSGDSNWNVKTDLNSDGVVNDDDVNIVRKYSGQLTSSLASCTTSQPSITVTSPNGGETWKVGETHNITWTSSNVNDVKIMWYAYDSSGNALSPMAGTLLNINSSTNVGQSISATSGQYAWIIGSSAAEKQIISEANGANIKSKMSVFDASNGNTVYTSDYFTIVAPIVTELCPDANSDGKVNALDLLLVRQAFSSKAGDSNWNSKVDFNSDGIINDDDLNVIRKYYLQTTDQIPSCTNTTSFNYSQNSLASISDAVQKIIQQIKELAGK